VESELSPSLPELPGQFPAAELLVLAATGVALTGCLWVGWVLVKRLQRGESLVPLRPHEPVLWGGNDVATVLFLLLAAQLVAVAMMPGATPPQTAETLVSNTSAPTISTGDMPPISPTIYFQVQPFSRLMSRIFSVRSALFMVVSFFFWMESVQATAGCFAPGLTTGGFLRS
jgi:hypothetical protein